MFFSIESVSHMMSSSKHCECIQYVVANFLCPLAVSFEVVLQGLCEGILVFELLPALVYKRIPV